MSNHDDETPIDRSMDPPPMTRKRAIDLAMEAIHDDARVTMSESTARWIAEDVVRALNQPVSRDYQPQPATVRNAALVWWGSLCMNPDCDEHDCASAGSNVCDSCRYDGAPLYRVQVVS